MIDDIIGEYLIPNLSAVGDIVDRKPGGGRIVKTDKDICRDIVIKQRLKAIQIVLECRGWWNARIGDKCLYEVRCEIEPSLWDDRQ